MEVGSRSSTAGHVALEVVDHQLRTALGFQDACQGQVASAGHSSVGRSSEVGRGHLDILARWALGLTTFVVSVVLEGTVGSAGDFG